ncbi:MAG: hypothetical protein M5R36_10435 [Deltaproteobacteria bacterium]|nr:hypothetical protein [Deltaproteobacteria bacterium]
MPAFSDNDIIAAIATARGVAGVAVIRVSGPGALDLVRPLFRPKRETEIAPRRMIYGAFVDDAERAVDDGFLVFFPAPASFTGEDVVELHTHGGLAAPAAVLRLVAERGARMAEPANSPAAPSRRAVSISRRRRRCSMWCTRVPTRRCGRRTRG